MNFLLSAKENINTTPVRQFIKNEHDTLNIVRNTMLAMESMEETSADLRSMNLIQEVKEGKIKVLEDPITKRVLIIHLVYNTPPR